MATSVVYSGVFGRARFIAFRENADGRLRHRRCGLDGGTFRPGRIALRRATGRGTDINRALGYCQGLVRQPHDTILVLISDLFEGGNQQEMLKRAAALVGAGVHHRALLALNDEGAPVTTTASPRRSPVGIPSFACTPDLFPELMAAAINRQDITQWAAAREIVTRAAASD